MKIYRILYRKNDEQFGNIYTSLAGIASAKKLNRSLRGALLKWNNGWEHRDFDEIFKIQEAYIEWRDR